MAADSTDDLDPPAASRRARVVRRILIVALIVVGLGLMAGVGTALWLNASLSGIEKIDVTVTEANRPEPSQSEALNILMLGADAGSERNGPGTSIIKDAAKEVWPRGKYRSDAMMLVHIDADRSNAYVVSIPRDSYLPVHDQAGEMRETTKINAALSLYGPSGALSTVENFAGERIDHLAMVDWDGFKAITDALGGVTVTTRDQGTHRLNGTEALEYVRERHDLPHGDFDRIRRQQNFLRAVMTKLVARGTLLNPIKLKKTLDSVATSLAVDDGWENGDIRSLAVSMRGIDEDDVTFLTIPTRGTSRDPLAGSIVVVDRKACDGLFQAMKDDDMAGWVETNKNAVLEDPDQIR